MGRWPGQQSTGGPFYSQDAHVDRGPFLWSCRNGEVWWFRRCIRRHQTSWNINKTDPELFGNDGALFGRSIWWCLWQDLVLAFWESLSNLFQSALAPGAGGGAGRATFLWQFWVKNLEILGILIQWWLGREVIHIEILWNDFASGHPAPLRQQWWNLASPSDPRPERT